MQNISFFEPKKRERDKAVNNMRLDLKPSFPVHVLFEWKRLNVFSVSQ